MGFLPAFVRPFQPPVSTYGAAALWYRVGGAPLPVAVYQPKGAASLAASYINLVNPGTFDAAPGTAPTFNAVTGWGFTTFLQQYLTTGITIGVSRAYSILVRASGLVIIGGIDYALIGGLGPAAAYPRIALDVYNSGGVGKFGYGNGGYLGSAAAYVSGVYGIAAETAYYNGGNVGIIPSVAGSIPELYIGARHWSTGARDEYLTGNIQAIVVWDTATDHAIWLPAVSAAMALL